MKENEIQNFYIEFNGAWIENHVRVSSTKNLNMMSNATGCPNCSGVFQHAESKFAFRFALWLLWIQALKIYCCCWAILLCLFMFIIWYNVYVRLTIIAISLVARCLSGIVNYYIPAHSISDAPIIPIMCEFSLQIWLSVDSLRYV